MVNKAGCILVNKDTKQIALVYREQFNDISFPKGHVEEGETEHETAIREVKEETNYDVEIVNEKRFVERYIIDNKIDKEVVYFIAKKIGGEAEKQESEVTDIKWCSFDEAIETVTFDNLKQLLKNVYKEI